MVKYNLFDPNFVYASWDDTLFQKSCLFVADTIEELEASVNFYECLSGRTSVLRNDCPGSKDDFPFRVHDDTSLSDTGIVYKLCYYDPLYNVKLGYSDGITVLRRVKGSELGWVTDPNPTWDSSSYDYRLATSDDCAVGTTHPPLHNNTSNTDMSLFDEKCIYRTWEPELEGKPCWFADNFYAMENAFYSSSPELIGPSGSFDYPFILCRVPLTSESRLWRYAYYDRYLELKKARKRGDIIEYYSADGWCLVPADAEFIYPPESYRVRPSAKPFDLATHRELARWINLGKGELTLSDRSVIGPECVVTHSFDYEVGEADIPVNDDIRVRSWDSDEWTSPTREYLGLC